MSRAETGDDHDIEGIRREKIGQALELLSLLGMPAEQQNERSALVLLALLNLQPSMRWDEASNPMIGTTPIMTWISEHYGRVYAPNTRETVRRQTLHQFIAAALVVENPDQPDRPINSPKWCYQLEPTALALLRTYEKRGFDRRLATYRESVPALRERWARERDVLRIPVSLPDGGSISLSAGGQNVLIAQMLEEFCPIFTPGAKVLYVGDADVKWAVWEQEYLEALGVTVDEHGKMPDLVVHMPDRNWLVLLEAASTHGPVDSKRQDELRKLFAGAEPGLVFVSCFPSRDEMRKYLGVIAWETEVWCADAPTHLIHFNGERFLGPRSS